MPTQPLDVDGLHHLLWGFAGQRVVTVAAKAGILRHLARQPATCAELATALGLDEPATGKVVRALVALGLLAADGDGYRIVAPLADCFGPGSTDFGPFIAHAHELYDRWGGGLEPWLRGEPLPPPGPRDPAGFGAAMQAMGIRVARQAAAIIGLDGVTHLLDVGGGIGHYSRVFCAQAPGLRATVLDLPETAELGRAALQGTELGERIAFVGGSYLDLPDSGEKYDLVLLANVLHQELADNAARMVAGGAAVLQPGGRLVVIDFVIDEAQQEHVFGTLFAINMRSRGDTYPESVIRSWLAAAGLGNITRVDLNDYRWLLMGHKPAG